MEVIDFYWHEHAWLGLSQTNWLAWPLLTFEKRLLLIMSLFVKHCRQTKHSIGILSTCMTAYCGMRSKATEIHTSNPLVVQGHRQSNHQRQTPRIVSPDFSISLLAVSTSRINRFLFNMCVWVVLDQRNLPRQQQMYSSLVRCMFYTSGAVVEGCVDPAPLKHTCKIEIY